MPMRPTDVRFRLNRLSELAKGRGELQRVLENVDLIAQEALDATTTYVNKKGEAVTFESPQLGVALKAQEVAAKLLGRGVDASPETKPAGQESAVVAAIRGEGLRVAK